jgi:hypothetical protein
MKPSTKDNTEGKMHQAKGKIKETAGKVDIMTKQQEKVQMKARVPQQTASRLSCFHGPGEIEETKKRSKKEEGKVGWILLWALGIPIPILLLLFFLRGCT